MAVTVRLFASAREAAGTDQTEATPGPLSEILTDLCARWGEPFTSRLAACTILVDGHAAGRDRDVIDGAEVAILPPSSGG